MVEKLIKVVFLGVCAFQTDKHETVSFMIDFGKRILFETGPSVIRQLSVAGYSPAQIDAVFISHCHADHALGFPYLLFMDSVEYSFKRGQKRVLPLITIPSVGKRLLEISKFHYPFTEFPAKVELLEASPDEVRAFDIFGAKITTAPVIHSVPTIGARIELPDCVIAYSSDSVYCDNVVKLAKDCYLLIHEAITGSNMKDVARKLRHGTAEEAGKVAQEANAKALALVHLLPVPSVTEKDLIKEAKGFFYGKIFVPKVPMTWEI